MAILVQDNFTDTNGTQITAHTPDVDVVGNGWILTNSGGGQPTGNELTIESNQLTMPASFADHGHGCIIDAGQADVTIEIDWTTQAQAAKRLNLFTREINTQNRNTIEFTAGLIGLYAVVSGVETTIQEEAHTFANNTTYSIKVVISGNDYEVYVDNVLELTGTTSANSTGTHFGPGNSNSSDEDMIADNFLIHTGSISPGDIASAEGFQNDSSIANVKQTITSTSIGSGENFPTDLSIADNNLTIEGSGAIASQEAVSGALTIGALVDDNPGEFFSGGVTTGPDGEVHAVSVGRLFGGSPTDIFIHGTRCTENGAMYVTLDSPGSGDKFINGLLHSPTGVRYIVDGTGVNRWPEGFASDVEGREATTTVIGGFFIRGIARDVDGRMVVDF